MPNLVAIQSDGPVVTITLNRPEQHNSFTPDLLAALLDALTAARHHHGVRVAVLQATGPSFSRGTDIAGLAGHADRALYADQVLRQLHQVMLAVIDLPVPLVVAVQGPATGSAMGLVLAADVVLVAPEASFTAYTTTLGLSPEGGWATLLPRLIGQRRAAEALLLERPISAAEAVAWGLANRLVPASHLAEETQALAHQMAAQLPGSIACTRRLLWSERDRLAAELDRERELFCAQIQSIEADIGLNAFLDRQRAMMTEADL
ncbi:enoyl-CoA hydratase/isomerase family protein [Chloroflexus sp.]|uniref:enoyl-CoA hydratase/isomerase family protein n=1 Tax=Chloroflexus sp. TaxID=1904827 RepID=UPI00298EFDC0|nr:enoyl-CoA hydratase/isomerase family protein [Chloroflexus sp.]MCS6886652.1 enoyl-CoA hydratase/isomerase family protein [Chloroflexus sp.]MDW8403515.1 enoyl-CoA hydratase/isomerase family protein [Chloroflexus sp.]